MGEKFILTIICYVFLSTSVTVALRYAEDIPRGPYCETRYSSRECCKGRRDECSFPILGTQCYCDEFCDRRTNEDCCPDYWSHCQGEPNRTYLAPEPFRRCFFNGKEYNYGATFNLNCNTCTCSSVGERAEVLCEDKRCIVETDVFDEIRENKNELGWMPTNYTKFWGRTLKEGLELRLGTLDETHLSHVTTPISHSYQPETLPREFDSRSHWPRYISGIRDQGWCGASWAMSTTSVASDRFAIMSKGNEIINLSPQDLLSCNNRGQTGCKGGYVTRAWAFIKKKGIADEDCYPWLGGETHRCKIRSRTTYEASGCTNPSNPSRTELYKVGPPYRLGNETDIMHEIMHSGPVQATMRVYQDFFIYESGVYRHSRHVENYPSAYHSVRIIGWGEEQNVSGIPVKYWLVANSWGQDWGENGYFKIAKGSNECQIESLVLGTWAYITKKA